jgi:hypothetical protein
MFFSDPAVRIIRIVGAALLALSLAFGVWAYPRWDSLPNFLRLALLIPFAFGVPLFSIRDYGPDWAGLSPLNKGRAIGWLLAPFVITVGAVAWYLSDPAAKA